jgi:chorismate mutase
VNTSTPSPVRHTVPRGVAIAIAVGLMASGAALPTTPAVAAAAHTVPATGSTGSTMTVTHDTAPARASSTQLDAIGDLVLRRLVLADPVAESKWLSGGPIADPAREQAVVDEAVALARQQGVDPALVSRVVRAQISASKVVQRGLVNHWTHEPWTAPTTAPDLSTIRPQLDAIDTELVAAVGVVQTLPRDPRCAHLVDAERKRLDVGLDSLHRKGIHVAWAGFCAA